MSEFNKEKKERIIKQPEYTELVNASRDFMKHSTVPKYSYNFEWMGRPIIQYPQDMVAVQELIWKVKPDLIIETGIAHGGSLVLNASILALLDLCEAIETGNPIDPNIPGMSP